jgi:hypothetical protein
MIELGIAQEDYVSEIKLVSSNEFVTEFLA